MEFVAAVILGGLVAGVANAIYSVVAVFVAIRVPRVFTSVAAASVLVLAAFVVHEFYLIYFRLIGVPRLQLFDGIPLLLKVTAFFGTPPAFANVVILVGRRLKVPVFVIWVSSFIVGFVAAMFMHIEGLIIADDGQ